jgi:hypothetical protein
VNPSFEYGGTVGEKVRYYALNSYTSTNRGIEPPTLGHSVFHDQSERNQTYLRGDYQHDNRNSLSWVFLNAVAKYQIPTLPGLAVNQDVLSLLQTQDPTFSPAASQAANQNQKENSQYTHLVWRHDVNAENFFQLAGFLRNSQATFTTDPFNTLAYVPEEQTANQKRTAYSLGTRLDYTWTPHTQHLVKTGFQFQYTNAQNEFQLFDFARNPVTGLPVGLVLTQTAANTNVQKREELWVQDQWSPTDHWTLNLGMRYDQIQSFYDEGQISPRLGVTYKLNQSNVFHANYSRLFTPPNVEQIAFTKVNLQGTTAQPDDPTGFAPGRSAPATRSGSYHARITGPLELAAYYKQCFQSDAGQFGTTPMLNFLPSCYQMGIDGALKCKYRRLSTRATWRGAGEGQRVAVENYWTRRSGHQYCGRRVCDHCRQSPVQRWRPIGSERTTTAIPMVQAYGPRRRYVYQLFALPVIYHLQCLSTHVFTLPWANKMLVDSMPSICRPEVLLYR